MRIDWASCTEGEWLNLTDSGTAIVISFYGHPQRKISRLIVSSINDRCGENLHTLPRKEYVNNS